MSRSPYLVNRAFRTFAVSTILAVMATSLGVVVNGMIVGNMMGSAELSAVNLVSPLIQLYNAVTALICVGGATLCAVLVGKGKEGESGRVFTICMAMTLCASILLTIVGLVSPGSAASFLCSDETLLPLVTDYTRVALLGSAAYLFLPGLAMFVRVDGSPRSATLALAGANIASPLLCIALVHSGMGLTGASAAVVIGYAAGTLALVIRFVRARSTTLFRLEKGGRTHIPAILALGAPVALASAMMVAKMLCMNGLTLHFLGTSGMATMAVAMNVLMLASMLIGGTCQTIQPIGGTLYGSGDVEGISMLTRLVSKVLLTSLGAIVAVVMLFPGVFCMMFGVSGGELLSSSEEALRLFAPCILLYGVNYALMILFQVLGHRRVAIAVSVLQPLLVIAVAFVLAPIDGELIWPSFWIGEAIMLAVIACMSVAMRRRDPSLRGFLLGRMPEIPTLAVSIRGDLSDLEESMDAVSGFLASNGVDAERAEKARLCCEELASNVSVHGLGSDPSRCMDLVVRAGDEPSILIRDDGPLFNPMAFDGDGIGLQIAKGICGSMAYSRAMGQNNVRFTFRYYSGNTEGSISSKDPASAPARQPIHDIRDVDPFLRTQPYAIHGQNSLAIVVAYRFQRTQLAHTRLLRQHRLGYLVVVHLIPLERREVHLGIPVAAYTHLVPAAAELQIHEVLQRPARIGTCCTPQHAAPHPEIRRIVLAPGLQNLPFDDIVAFRIVEEPRVYEGVHIAFDGGFADPHHLRYPGHVGDVPDIGIEETRDVHQHVGPVHVQNTENVLDENRVKYSVEVLRCIFFSPRCVETRQRTVDEHIRKCILGIRYPTAFHNLGKTQRQDIDLDVPAGNVRCQIGREHLRIRTGDIYVATLHGAECRNAHLPALDVLDLIEHQERLVVGRDVGSYPLVQRSFIGNLLPLESFEIYSEYAIGRSVVVDEILLILLQKHRFPAAAHSCHHLHNIIVAFSVVKQLQIPRPADFHE